MLPYGRELARLAFDKGMRVQHDGSVIGIRGRLLKTVMNDGYRCVSIRVGPGRGTTRPFKVYWLQAYQKFGEALFPAETVRHLNNKSDDDGWDNLALGTHHDNQMDRPLAMRLRCVQAAANARRVLTEAQVIEMRRLRREGRTGVYLSRLYAVSCGTVSDVVNYKLYKNVQ